MELALELECPQCGGNVELSECDHLLHCPFCGIKNFLVSKGLPRFVLPHQETELDLVHVPYIRFRGSLYNCNPDGVTYRIIDITDQGGLFDFLPHNLGLRPQAMKMKFANPNQAGDFLRCHSNIEHILSRASKPSRIKDGDYQKIYHQAFVGETTSIIYLPIAIDDNQIFDAITGDRIAEVDNCREIFARLTDRSLNWKPGFLPTICPGCGWDLIGERDSVVLGCSNCQTFWAVNNGNFINIAFQTSAPPDTKIQYMPFWKITVEADELKLNNYADLIIATRQPRIVQKQWQNLPLNFWVPAFKIKPKSFLRLATQMTFAQEKLALQENYPLGNLHKINLGYDGACQSLMTIYAHSTVNKMDLFPDLPNMNFDIKKVAVVYIPFSDQSYSFVHEQTGININKQALNFGSFL